MPPDSRNATSGSRFIKLLIRTNCCGRILLYLHTTSIFLRLWLIYCCLHLAFCNNNYFTLSEVCCSYLTTYLLFIMAKTPWYDWIITMTLKTIFWYIAPWKKHSKQLCFTDLFLASLQGGHLIHNHSSLHLSLGEYKLAVSTDVQASKHAHTQSDISVNTLHPLLRVTFIINRLQLVCNLLLPFTAKIQAA